MMSKADQLAAKLRNRLQRTDHSDTCADTAEQDQGTNQRIELAVEIDKGKHAAGHRKHGNGEQSRVLVLGPSVLFRTLNFHELASRRRGIGSGTTGRAGGFRTPNLRFWRPPLCQLSYWPAREPRIRRMDGAAVYFRILDTTPAPTVRPPSRIAKRRPSSIAIGLISSIVILMLSPGITISTPSGNSTEPVTSVVRK